METASRSVSRRILLATLAVVLVAGISCGSSTSPGPDLLLASALDVSIYIGSADLNGNINASIAFSRKGKSVTVAENDYVWCNGDELSLRGPISFTLGPTTYSATVHAGNGYEFVYKHHGNSTTILVPGLPGPRITSPQPGTLLDRGVDLNVTYEPAAGSGHISAELSQTTTDSTGYQTSAGVGGPEELDIGTYTFDRAMLYSMKPGMALLQLRKEVKTMPKGTGFDSVVVYDTASTLMQIQWR